MQIEGAKGKPITASADRGVPPLPRRKTGPRVVELIELVAGIGGHWFGRLYRARHAEWRRANGDPCCVRAGVSRRRCLVQTVGGVAAFFGTFVVITAGKIGIRAFDATCIFLGLAALFAAYGLLRGAAHPIGGLPLQAIAMAAFGTVAAIALIVSGTAGAYLVATGLLAHAAWTFITTGATKLWSARWPSSAVSWTRCLPWRL